MGREGVLYHIRLIVTLNQISGNPYIWAQPNGRRQLPNRIKILCVLLLYCIYFISTLHTLCPIGEFRLTTLKSELTHSHNTCKCVQERTLYLLAIQ